MNNTTPTLNLSEIGNETDVLSKPGLEGLYDYKKDPKAALNVIWYICTHYVTFVLFAFSFIGNSLILLVLSSKKSRHFSTSIYLMSLAISDLVVNCFSLRRGLIEYGLMKVGYSDIQCKIGFFLKNVGYYVSAWTLAAISVERVLSIVIPHKVKLICTVNFARILVLVIWIVLNIPLALLSTLPQMFTFNNGRTNCFIKETYANYYFAYQLWVMIVQYMLPFVLIFTCTFIILTAMYKRLKNRSKSGQKDRYKLTWTLIFVNFAYFIFLTPFTTYVAVYEIRLWLGDFYTLPALRNYFKIHDILTILRDANSVVNFYLYFLSGTRFRQDTIDFLLGPFKRLKDNSNQRHQ